MDCTSHMIIGVATAALASLQALALYASVIGIPCLQVRFGTGVQVCGCTSTATPDMTSCQCSGQQQQHFGQRTDAVPGESNSAPGCL